MVIGTVASVCFVSGMAWLCSSFSSSKRSDAIGVAITGTGLGVVGKHSVVSGFSDLPNIMFLQSEMRSMLLGLIVNL